MKNKKGFTLVELMVVIAIIGLLSSTVITSLSSSRAKGREAKRMSDMTEVYQALVLFYNANGRYPTSADGNCTHLTSFLPGGCLQTLVTGGYLPSIPADPTSGAQYYYDNWCNVGGTGNHAFRMWTLGEFSHGGLAQNWWVDQNFGFTTCDDPS